MSDLKHKELAGRWEVLIKECTESGMNIKEWCYAQGINESRYYYWSRTLCTVGNAFCGTSCCLPGTEGGQGCGFYLQENCFYKK